MKTKIFIDFDGTLFDNASFKVKLFNEICRFGFSDREILEAYKKVRNCFLPERFLNQISPAINKKQVDFFTNRLNKEISSLLFADSIDFLQKINREKYEVDLLTFGDPAFQKRKIRLTKIRKYFDKVFYVEGKKNEYLTKRKKENFIVIDDDVPTVEAISADFPTAIIIQINRYSNPIITKNNIFNVVNLKQVEKYLDEGIYARVT